MADLVRNPIRGAVVAVGLHPKPCRGGEDSRQLLLLLLVRSGPAVDGPAAIQRTEPLLEARG